MMEGDTMYAYNAVQVITNLCKRRIPKENSNGLLQ